MHTQRQGRFCAVALASARCQERAMVYDIKRKRAGEGGGAHRGLDLVGETAQGGRRRGPGGGSAWSSRRGSVQGFPGLLGSTGRLVVFLRRCYWGQEGRGTTGGEGSKWQRGGERERACVLLGRAWGWIGPMREGKGMGRGKDWPAFLFPFLLFFKRTQIYLNST
jgi:hypothetical protein